MTTSTVENADNESMVKRAPIADGWVELHTLRPGDIFYNDFCRGKVVHRASNGNMVEVLFDGHKVAQSVAPSLRVKHGGGLVLPEELRKEVTAPAPVATTTVAATATVAVAPVAIVKPVVPVKTFVPTPLPVAVTPAPAPVIAAPVIAAPVIAAPVIAAPVIAAPVVPPVAVTPAPVPVAAVVPPVAPGAVVPKVAPTPAPARPGAIVRLIIPTTQAPVMATAPVARVARSTAPATSASDLTPEQIAALPQALRKSVGALISHALLNGWSKTSTFAACKAFFPSLKAGQNFKSCTDQLNLYRMNLRRAGKLS